MLKKHNPLLQKQQLKENFATRKTPAFYTAGSCGFSVNVLLHFIDTDALVSPTKEQASHTTNMLGLLLVLFLPFQERRRRSFTCTHK